eukprot:TRINITY_DN4259_c0_g1_i1.p1 TRINITY_DN4259_c0_g1~~TRINITY_DN4259_c0_g1_i1.p1  ORF type:complete len:149 (-),score=37.12 TRINITY_DN4259_c0_g1_i1:138-584(-)
MGNRQQLKAEATTQKMITSISSIFWGEHSEPNTESEHTEDESSDDEEWVVVGPSSKADGTPNTALYSLPPGDPAFTVMDNTPLTPEVSQEVILLIERIKNDGNNAGVSEIRRHALGGAGLGGKALKRGNMTRGSWINKHCFCKNIKQC